MSALLEDFLVKLKQAKEFPPVDSVPLVSPFNNLEWLGADKTGNASKLALYLESPAKTFEIFFQEIPPHSASDLQRHHHESIHFVIEGNGYSEIENEVVRWQQYDSVYTPPWAWHRHYNDSDQTVKMLGIENSRLLDAVGPINRRESQGNITWSEYQQKLADNKSK